MPKTDKQLLRDVLQSCDDSWIDREPATYLWYRAVGQTLMPKSILELGVRYGYSAVAVLQGVGAPACLEVAYAGVDSEYDGVKSNALALQMISLYTPYAHIFPVNTAAIDSWITDRSFDLVHVDGDHSPTGIVTELNIALSHVQRTGYILVDDIDTPHVKAAADAFCSANKLCPIFIPTFHGMMLLAMSDPAGVEARLQANFMEYWRADSTK